MPTGAEDDKLLGIVEIRPARKIFSFEAG